MLNKIDKKLLGKIKTLEYSDDLVDIIVSVKSYKLAKNELKKYSENLIVDLPIVSSIAMSTKYKNIFYIAKLNNVKFVASDAVVCGLIHNSKQIINSDKLLQYVNYQNNHSCVVIDTGVYPHIDFCLGRNRIIHFVDLVGNREYPYDDNGHGTFISGVLLGNSITDKYSGIDSSSNLIVIKALDKSGETSSVKILQAMQWVLDNKDRFNIKVVCMSFGSQVVEDNNDPLVNGADILWDNGIVVVSAAGNSGPESSTIMSPGASKKVITVGSMDVVSKDKYKVADFSSRGPILNQFKPDMVVPGVDIVSTVNYYDKKFYGVMSGTSVSTPMVAGVVSLLYKINPNYTPNQIKYMLINSCEIITGDRNSEGFGRLDLDKIELL